MLQTHRVRTLDQVRSFLAGAEPVEVQPLERSARYEFVAQTLRRFGYWQLGKARPGGGADLPQCPPFRLISGLERTYGVASGWPVGVATRSIFGGVVLAAFRPIP